MVVSELQRLEARYAMPTYARAPVEFVRGEGWRVWDSEGNEYLDFFAGLSVSNAGHCHPRIVAAIREQAATLAGMSNLYYSEPALRLAERLSESSLGGKVFLANTGTEANECAIKLARKHAHLRGIERARDRRPRARLPRPHAGLARGDGQARPRGPLRPAAARLRRRPARRPGGAARPRSASGPPRSCSSRSRASRASSRSATRCSSRRARRARRSGRC